MDKVPVALLFGLFMVAGPAIAAETMSSKAELCGELVQAAETAAIQHRGLGNAVAKQVDGGEALEEKACLSDLQGFDFDLFASIPSFSSSVLKEAMDRAKEEMTNMACDAASEAIDSANTLLTCTAAVGVSLDAQAGFDDLNVEECGGYGLDETIDGGSHSIGGNGNTIGGKTETSSRSGVGGAAEVGGGADRSGNRRSIDSWDSWVN